MPRTENGKSSGRSTDEETEIYTVGYGRPPSHSRWKPGQSGNKKGRPKGSRNYATILDQVLREKITIQDGSKTRLVTKGEALNRILVVRALKDPKWMATLLSTLRSTGRLDPQPEDGQTRFDPDAVIRDFVTRGGLDGLSDERTETTHSDAQGNEGTKGSRKNERGQKK